MKIEELEERDSDLEILEENEFPYMSGRLKHIDYEAIIAEGKPWKDPVFPYGKVALFINNSKPRKGQEELKKKWLTYHWKRASEFF